jgi:hypothetical protein
MSSTKTKPKPTVTPANSSATFMRQSRLQTLPIAEARISKITTAKTTLRKALINPP